MANMLLSTDEMIEMFQGRVSSGLQSAIKLHLRGELKSSEQIVSKLIIIYIIAYSRFKCSCMLHNLTRWIIHKIIKEL